MPRSCSAAPGRRTPRRIISFRRWTDRRKDTAMRNCGPRSAAESRTAGNVTSVVRAARLRCARRRGVAAARGRGRRRRGGGGRRALRTLRGRRRPGAGADAARQIPHAEDAALLAQPHPDGGRQRQRARGRTSGQVELQGQAAGPHHRGDALSQARGRDRAAEHPARHPLRRRRWSCTRATATGTGRWSMP